MESPQEKFSISDFKSFMPIPLSCPLSKPIFRLHVFSDSPQESPEPRNPTSNFCNSITKQKIKAALELFDFAHSPTLVQFWARTVAKNQQVFLQTSDLPFGLSVLRKGLCSFRKRCLNRRYSADDADERGPPVRVFRRRFPEFCPDVGSYSAEEYELKDFAVANGIRGYLSLPVYEPDWQCCIGVLEILTIMDGSYYFSNVIHRVSDSLKEVGLMSSDVFWPFDMKRLAYNQIGNGPPEYRVLDEIQKVLDVLCKTYKLPFAQTWVFSSDENGEEIMSTTEEGSHSTKKVSSFQKDCSWFHLRKGQGIVWKAFSSGTSCFCRDITRLSITEYALVLSARRAHLSGGFAICLQSSCTGTAVYVIELFLPSDQNVHKQPSSFMSSMLVTMKQQFRTLKLGSGQEIGKNLPVAVLKISNDDPLDSFVISQTVEGQRNQGNKAQQRQENTASSSYVFECSQDGGVVQSHDVTTHNRRNGLHPHQTINVAMRTLSLGEAVISPKVLEKRHGKRPTNFPDNPNAKRSTSKKQIKVECPLIPHKSEKEVEIIPVQESCYVSPLDETPTSVSSLSPVATLMQSEETIMTVKVVYEGDIIKFKVPVSSGMKKLKDEVMKRIELTAGTFEIKYHCEDNICIRLDSDAKLQERMSAIRSLGMSTIKLFITTIHLPTENEVKITVKASFKDDLIKFQISVSAGMSELKNEMIKRLKLEDGCFEIKYGDENNCWILLDSDAALQNCMSKVKSVQKTTMKLSIEPMRTRRTMIVKASYRDDIIKFQLSPSSGMKELEDEVRKRLKLEAGSFVIKCVNGDNNEISLDGEAALASQLRRMTSMGIHKFNVSLQPTNLIQDDAHMES
ncbi:hypothetical protein ACS0TY_001552 [Phlomoides rotata]